MIVHRCHISRHFSFRTIICLTIAATGMVLAPAGHLKADGPAYALKYKFRPNQTIAYEARNVSVFTVRKGPASQVTENESTTQKHLRVISVDSSNNAILESTIDRIRSSVKFDREEPTVYDSTSGKVPPRQFRRIHKILGKPLVHLKVTQHGKMIKAVPQQALAGSGPEQQDAATGDVSHNFVVSLPEQPVKVGDSWQDFYETKVSIGAKLKRDVKIQRKYTLKSVSQNLATIQIKSIIITHLRDPQIKVQVMQRTPQGIIEFDMERGLVVSKKLTINNTEHGFAGDGSTANAVSEYTEKLIDSAEQQIQQTSSTKEQ